MSLFVLFGLGCRHVEPVPEPKGTSSTSSRIIDRSEPPVVEGCPPFAAVISNKTDHGRSCFFTINPQLPMYEFRLNTIPLPAKTTMTVIDTIDVFPPGATSPEQTLTAHTFEDPGEETTYLTGEDMNFDGYKDLKLQNAWGATGNSAFDIWLFDPKSFQFIYNKVLSNLMGAASDPQTKTVTSHGNTSASDGETQTYIWKHGALTLVTQKVQSFDPVSNIITCTIDQFTEGKIIKTTKQDQGCWEE